mmetsp:Transcript_3209/g.4844  ORF Transcript_3209/g.4844 Transcript_3209/m.4844 type:complete len:419 (-) Transcript_3209:164-1420(-)
MTEYEFGGPVGVVFMMLFLPATILGLFTFCDDKTAGCPNYVALPDFGKHSYFSVEANLVLIGWMVFLMFLWAVIPGAWADGVKLPTGGRLKYKLNGFSSGCITTICLIAGHLSGIFDLVWIYDNYLQLASAAILLSTLMSIMLYISARLKYSIPSGYLAGPGSTGIAIYDFFMGHELNPRIGDLDLKQFCELRPGLIGWAVINASCALKQYRETGMVTNAMWLVNIFQLIYVVDALWFEKAILTTMDITTDGFGFMLVFGDLAWVPFTYSLQARYLATFKQSEQLSVQMVLFIVAVKMVGMAIFRGANSQKNKFRTDPMDPSVRHLKTIPTERGTRLLISGWWGIARHINYFGDWVMAWAWCLPCGFDHIIPYFYAIYFGGLLVHREMRDEHNCKNKYGKDWDKYCSIVKWRIIPFLY